MEDTKDRVEIRMAKREDCAAIMELKIELAAHSKMNGLPMLSVQDLERDGFDVKPPCFQCLVAEVHPKTVEGSNRESQKRIVGYALYFYAYAAWEGKTLHLEDLCVSENVRGGGIGKKLIKQLAKIAVEEKCARIQFEVLEWNPSRKFYDSLGGLNTTEGEGWHNFRLDAEGIKKLVQN